MKKILTLILSVIILTAACQQKEHEQAVNEKSFVISDSWMRPGSMNRNTAAFMKIFNNTDIDDTLYNVSSDAAKVVEIHETYKKDDDMMGMRHIDYLIIPKNSVVELKPGSFHIMFIGLNEDLGIDQNSELKLFFRNNGEIELDLKVLQNKM